VEEFKDTLSLTSITTTPRIFIAKDGFYIGESDIFSGHFLIDEALLAESSYIFSGHEWLGETLYPAEGKVVAGWGADIEDSFGVEEDHFDGNWVEQMPNQFSLGDTILTSQWRHEFFFGICISSRQIEPIEQECPEGDRRGEITAQYWQSLGYN
jgi:hypothetical protein